MKVAIVGVGGAGGYFGARLAEAGHDVAFVARGAHLAAIQAHGLRVDSIAGDVTIAPAHATADPSTIGPVDAVLLGVKTWQVAEAAASARPLVGAATTVMPLQNGVEAAATIASVLGPACVIGGIARILSFIAAPGHIRHTGVSAQLELGELDGTRSPRVTALHDAFAATRGVTVTIAPDIVAALWAKFLFISAWGGVGATARAPVGVVRAMSETRALIERSMHEIAAVALASNVALPAGAIAHALAAIDNLPAAGITSMQRDLEDGKPSELEHLVGGVVRIGARVGVPTPTMAVLYHALLPRERRARGTLAF